MKSPKAALRREVALARGDAGGTKSGDIRRSRRATIKPNLYTDQPSCWSKQGREELSRRLVVPRDVSEELDAAWQPPAKRARVSEESESPEPRQEVKQPLRRGRPKSSVSVAVSASQPAWETGPTAAAGSAEGFQCGSATANGRGVATAAQHSAEASSELTRTDATGYASVLGGAQAAGPAGTTHPPSRRSEAGAQPIILDLPAAAPGPEGVELAALGKTAATVLGEDARHFAARDEAPAAPLQPPVPPLSLQLSAVMPAPPMKNQLAREPNSIDGRHLAASRRSNALVIGDSSRLRAATEAVPPAGLGADLLCLPEQRELLEALQRRLADLAVRRKQIAGDTARAASDRERQTLERLASFEREREALEQQRQAKEAATQPVKSATEALLGRVKGVEEEQLAVRERRTALAASFEAAMRRIDTLQARRDAELGRRSVQQQPLALPLTASARMRAAGKPALQPSIALGPRPPAAARTPAAKRRRKDNDNGMPVERSQQPQEEAAGPAEPLGADSISLGAYAHSGESPVLLSDNQTCALPRSKSASRDPRALADTRWGEPSPAQPMAQRTSGELQRVAAETPADLESGAQPATPRAEPTTHRPSGTTAMAVDGDVDLPADEESGRVAGSHASHPMTDELAQLLGVFNEMPGLFAHPGAIKAHQEVVSAYSRRLKVAQVYNGNRTLHSRALEGYASRCGALQLAGQGAINVGCGTALADVHYHCHRCKVPDAGGDAAEDGGADDADSDDSDEQDCSLDYCEACVRANDWQCPNPACLSKLERLGSSSLVPMDFLQARGHRDFVQLSKDFANARASDRARRIADQRMKFLKASDVLDWKEKLGRHGRSQENRSSVPDRLNAAAGLAGLPAACRPAFGVPEAPMYRGDPAQVRAHQLFENGLDEGVPVLITDAAPFFDNLPFAAEAMQELALEDAIKTGFVVKAQFDDTGGATTKSQKVSVKAFFAPMLRGAAVGSMPPDPVEGKTHVGFKAPDFGIQPEKQSEAFTRGMDRLGIGHIVKHEGRHNLCSYLKSEAEDGVNGTRKPDLGPKFYIARPRIVRRERAPSAQCRYEGYTFTPLHCDLADAVNYSCCGEEATWSIFHRKDRQKVMQFLGDKHGEGRRGEEMLWAPSNHRLLDGSDFADLEREYGVRAWHFQQKAGEIVVIPAGCAHQVKNGGKGWNIKVAQDFVAPQSAGVCLQLLTEMREARQEDKVQAILTLRFAGAEANRQHKDCWRRLLAAQKMYNPTAA